MIQVTNTRGSPEIDNIYLRRKSDRKKDNVVFKIKLPTAEQNNFEYVYFSEGGQVGPSETFNVTP